MKSMTPLHTVDLREGTGLPLVLLHGFPLDTRMWVDCARALPAGIRVIGVDLPGAGHSDLPRDTPPALEYSARRVHDTLRLLGIGNAVVAGLSMGGYVALAMAEAYGDFVAGLGLVDTKSVADDDGARANRYKIADMVTTTQNLDAVAGMPAVLLSETSAKERRHLFGTLEAWIHSQTPAGVAWAQRAMAVRPDRTGVLESYGSPVAVVVGEQDALSPPEQADHMAAAAIRGGGDVVLTTVPGAGHMAPLEDPQPVADALAGLHQRVCDQ